MELEKPDGSLDMEAAKKFLLEVQSSETKPEPTKPAGDDTAPPDGKPSAENPADETGKGDDTGDAAKTPDTGLDWFSAEDVRDLVATLDLSQEDLREFSGPDELSRHVRLLDKQLAKIGAEAVKAGEAKPDDAQDAGPEATPEEARREAQRKRAAEQPRESGKFAKPPDGSAEDDLPQLDPKEFDEDLIKVITARDERIRRLEKMIAERESGMDESASRMAIQRFDEVVDALGPKELFGARADLKEGSEQFKARAKLWNAMALIAAGMERNGKPVREVTKGLVMRAMNYEFAQELQKHSHSAFVSRVRSQQSRRSLFGSVSKSLPGNSEAEREKALIERYKQMEVEGL